MQLICDFCQEPITEDQTSVSAPNGPVHVGYCADKLAEAIRDEYEEAYDYAHIHES